MLALLPLLLAIAVKADAPGQSEICRFVCPDTVGGSPLLEESLEPDGSAVACFWFGNGLGARFASFDSVCARRYNQRLVFQCPDDKSL